MGLSNEAFALLILQAVMISFAIFLGVSCIRGLKKEPASSAEIQSASDSARPIKQPSKD
jgi:ABC-type glycerol-3-phosphate transport system permease component